MRLAVPLEAIRKALLQNSWGWNQGGLLHQVNLVVGIGGHGSGGLYQRLASGRAQIGRPARDPMGRVWMPS